MENITLKQRERRIFNERKYLDDPLVQKLMKKLNARELEREVKENAATKKI